LLLEKRRERTVVDADDLLRCELRLDLRRSLGVHAELGSRAGEVRLALAPLDLEQLDEPRRAELGERDSGVDGARRGPCGETLARARPLFVEPRLREDEAACRRQRVERGRLEDAAREQLPARDRLVHERDRVAGLDLLETRAVEPARRRGV